MNKEMLFRGKRLDNGEWVYGNLIQMDEGGSQSFIFPFYKYASSLTCAQIVSMFMIAVDPTTIGQYTGLYDKNGVTKIFEGDILYKEGHWTFYVGYEMGAFRAIPLEPVQKLNWPHCTLEEFLRVGMGDCKGFKVIGNIHDTSKLAKEEESE